MHENCNCGDGAGTNCGPKDTCKCPHHKVIPAMVVLIGLTFLLGALNVITPTMVAILWPIFVVIAGGTKFAERSCTCC